MTRAQARESHPCVMPRSHPREAAGLAFIGHQSHLAADPAQQAGRRTLLIAL